MASADRSPAEKNLLASVCLDVHPRDSMYEPGKGVHYLGVGLSALRCIDGARGSAQAPRTVLDFGSGYGRVLRFLRVRFPDATIVASEIDPAALRFCRSTFGVRGLRSLSAFDDLSFAERYDLIWCGSLVTHVSEASALSLLGFFARHLTSGGMCVASTHGEVTINALRSGAGRYGLTPPAVEQVLAGFDANGYGYADYRGMGGYGISIATPEKMTEMTESVALEVANIQPRAWDAHHDVYAFTPAA